IDTNRLRTVGYGEKQPVASNDSEEGRSQNRRVTFVITANEKMKEDGPQTGWHMIHFLTWYFMKKRFLGLMVSLFFIMNTANAQMSVGVKGAVTMFNMSLKNNNDNKISTQMIPNFNLGLYADFPLAPEFAIRPEVLFATKGYKSEDLADAKTRLSYIEIPVTLLYKGALYGGNVLVGFGPYAAFGIGGKMTNGETVKVKFKNDISLQEATASPYFKPFDFWW
ncbi:MAG: outer membrane beta-barrel protein, partial [Bacteroidales bacterium]|nr:outer membrane beta-barrel protein [Bacteroidales bacterium]